MGHIWLVGMMGSGKTTVAEITAGMLDRPFIDTDANVVAMTGQTIPALFALGEEVFRDAETRSIAEVAGNKPSVIASGGGSVLRTENVEAMKASGRIVLLDVDSETATTRIGESGDRPLAASQAAIDRLLAEREAIYAAAADCVVSTLGRTPSEVAKEVAACVDM